MPDEHQKIVTSGFDAFITKPINLKQFLDNKDKSRSSGATGAEVQKTASLGTATGTAAKLSPSMRDGLIGLLQDQMRQCYTVPISASGGNITPPQIDVRLSEDGSLVGQPTIVNAGSSSMDRAVADAGNTVGAPAFLADERALGRLHRERLDRGVVRLERTRDAGDHGCDAARPNSGLAADR